MPVLPETNVRPTDMVADKPYSRLGNTGNALFDDLLDRFHEALGLPLQVDAENPAAPRVAYQAGIYTMPDGKRLTSFRNGKIPNIASGVIDFDNGTISTGANGSFTPPVMVSGNFVRALIQYSFGKDAIQVTFGTQDPSLGSATIPSAITDYEPIAIVELEAIAAGSGPGTFNNIEKTSIVSILDGFDFDSPPVEEVQTVSVASQTTFTLATLDMPAVRMRLDVFVNGIKQVQGTHYNVTSDTVVEFVDPVFENAEVTFRVE